MVSLITLKSHILLYVDSFILYPSINMFALKCPLVLSSYTSKTLFIHIMFSLNMIRKTICI